MLENNDTYTVMIESRRTFLVRVLRLAIPLIVILSPMLWLTGYPTKEWATVAAILAFCAMGAGTVMGVVVMLILKKVSRQALAFSSTQGMDAEKTVASANANAVFALRTFTMLSVGIATWGIAFYALTVVMGLMDMDPIAKHLGPVTLALFIICAAVFGTFYGLLSLLFYLTTRSPQRWLRLAKRLRDWIGNVRTVESAELRGVPSIIN